MLSLLYTVVALWLLPSAQGSIRVPKLFGLGCYSVLYPNLEFNICLTFILVKMYLHSVLTYL